MGDKNRNRIKKPKNPWIVADVDDEFVDNRHFHGKNGHTFRRTTYKCKQGDITVGRSWKSHATGRNSLTQPVPVTDVDQFFDRGFVTSRYHGDRPLKTLQAQEDVIGALESLSLSKHVEYSHWDNECTTTYEVPVIGHMISAERAAPAPTKEWLQYCGVFWNPEVLHAYYFAPGMDKATLKPLCPASGSIAFQERIRLGKIERAVNRIAVKAIMPEGENAAVGKAARKKQQRQSVSKSMEIDLGSVHELTHIGTIAGYPTWKNVSSFPPRDKVTDSGIVFKGRGRRHGKYRSVRVVRPEALGWLTSYTVQFRHVITRQWMDYSERLSGNIDMANEVRHPVSILTRYIRVVPVDWHQHAAATVMLYGHRQGQQREAIPQPVVSKGKKKNSRRVELEDFEYDEEYDSKQRAVPQDGDEQVETVSYTVTPKDYTSWRTDGNGTEKYGCYAQPTRANIRHNILRRMNEDVSIMEAA